MFIRISIWTKYRNSDLHICSMVWIYCKSPEFRGHYIFYSMYLITLYSKLVSGQKWQGGIEDLQEGGLSVYTDLFCYCCGRYWKKLVNAFSRYSYLSPHLHEGIQRKDSIFRVLDENTRHFNVCWVVWRMACLDMNTYYERYFFLRLQFYVTVWYSSFVSELTQSLLLQQWDCVCLSWDHTIIYWNL